MVFPKGRTASGEHMVTAVVRIVSERTGLSIRPGPWLGGTDYLEQGWPEHVDYFAAEVDPAVTGAFPVSDPPTGPGIRVRARIRRAG